MNEKQGREAIKVIIDNRAWSLDMKCAWIHKNRHIVKLDRNLLEGYDRFDIRPDARKRTRIDAVDVWLSSIDCCPGHFSKHFTIPKKEYNGS